MRLISAALLGLLATLSLAACKEEVSFNTLEDARGVAKENAMFNAQRWRPTVPGLENYDIMGRGDSTQSPSCPQGDGWASMDFISPDKTQTVKAKCSTVSGSIGCMTADDFKTKSYASEEGSCQPTTKVPFPLPKIAH